MGVHGISTVNTAFKRARRSLENKALEYLRENAGWGKVRWFNPTDGSKSPEALTDTLLDVQHGFEVRGYNADEVTFVVPERVKRALLLENNIHFPTNTFYGSELISTGFFDGGCVAIHDKALKENPVTRNHYATELNMLLPFIIRDPTGVCKLDLYVGGRSWLK